MRYEEAIDYLRGLERFGIRPGLARVNRLLDALGRPEAGLKIIHVAGTNGKGSTSAAIASILQAAGYRTGLYTSPHLSSYLERIRINGRPIPERDFTRLMERVKEAAGADALQPEESPTEFEAGTAAMYLYFAEQGVDLVVQETGLGGRLDATNVVERPLVSVITEVSLDHTARLGERVEQIAVEKAGIIKTGHPVVISPQTEAAAHVLRQAASSRGSSRLVEVGSDVRFSEVAVSMNGTTFRYEGLTLALDQVRVNLIGPHQAVNAATAIATSEALAEQGWLITEGHIREGLARVSWPGRFEVIPGPSAPIVLDGAHNPSAAAALVQGIRSVFPGRRPVIVTAIMKDKDRGGILKGFSDVADTFVLTGTPDERCSPPGDLACYLPRDSQVYIEPDPLKAVRLGVDLAGALGVVCVTGSLYLVGAVRPAILEGRLYR